MVLPPVYRGVSYRLPWAGVRKGGGGVGKAALPAFWVVGELRKAIAIASAGAQTCCSWCGSL